VRRFKGNLPEHLLNPTENKKPCIGGLETHPEMAISMEKNKQGRPFWSALFDNIIMTEKRFTDWLNLSVGGRIDAILHLINPSLSLVVLPLSMSQGVHRRGY